MPSIKLRWADKHTHGMRGIREAVCSPALSAHSGEMPRLQVECRRENELPRIDNPITVGRAIGIGADRLQPAAFLYVPHIQLEGGANLVREEARAISHEQIPKIGRAHV